MSTKRNHFRCKISQVVAKNKPLSNILKTIVDLPPAHGYDNNMNVTS